jgi:hypothetical protein
MRSNDAAKSHAGITAVGLFLLFGSLMALLAGITDRVFRFAFVFSAVGRKHCDSDDERACSDYSIVRSAASGTRLIAIR